MRAVMECEVIRDSYQDFTPFNPPEIDSEFGILFDNLFYPRSQVVIWFQPLYNIKLFGNYNFNKRLPNMACSCRYFRYFITLCDTNTHPSTIITYKPLFKVEFSRIVSDTTWRGDGILVLTCSYINRLLGFQGNHK